MLILVKKHHETIKWATDSHLIQYKIPLTNTMKL